MSVADRLDILEDQFGESLVNLFQTGTSWTEMQKLYPRLLAEHEKKAQQLLAEDRKGS